ncbi:MAG: hypothetical protein ACREP9_06435 [Candidatus Dormibacteraceae bacterium]
MFDANGEAGFINIARLTTLLKTRTHAHLLKMRDIDHRALNSGDPAKAGELSSGTPA